MKNKNGLASITTLVLFGSLGTLGSLASVGCGADHERLLAAGSHGGALGVTQTTPATVAPPSTSTTRTTPSSLACVSDASRTGDESVPHVWRVNAAFDGATASTTVARGRQFAAIDPAQADVVIEPTALALHVDVKPGAHGDAITLSNGDVTVRLHGDENGAFFRGSVSVKAGARKENLACWDQNTILGSPWGGVPGTLTAHFDWQSGACTGADGAPALNKLPIEFVRETGFGECADLSGVALNGDDMSGTSELQSTWLAGAKLDGATLLFANLSNASLFGTDVSALDFGYATVTGTVDDNTTLPSEGCTVSQSPWSGSSVSCAR